MTAQHTRQGTAPVEELLWMFHAEHIEEPLFIRSVLGHLVEILEKPVLPDYFRAALPSDEFEFGDALIGFKVESPAGIPGAERNIFDHFARLEDAGQAKENSQRMNHHIDLPGEALDYACRA